MKKLLSFVFILFFGSNAINAQKQISATIIDSDSKKSIPFVAVQFNNTSGVISNTAGEFQLHFKKKLTPKDSLHISFLGYETKHIQALKFKDSIITLKSKYVELNEIVLLNKSYTIDEIIAKTSENLSINYASGYSKTNLFYRESIITNTLKDNIKVKKTSIPEFNQKFIDSILLVMPKENEIYTELLANFYNSSKKKQSKLDIIRACNLYDNKENISLDNFEEKMNEILKKHIKRDSYFKIKSGLFGVKQDIDPTLFDDNTEESRKLNTEKEKNFFAYFKTSISSLKQENIIDKSSKLNFITKPEKYIYQLLGCISMGDYFVYKINFTPKNNASFKGLLYINTSDFAVVRADFENVKNLRSLNLLGVSFVENLYKGTFIYKKNNEGTYTLKYAEDKLGAQFSIDRPLKIIEKNKKVRGRRKQNEIAAKVSFKFNSTIKKELAVFDNASIKENDFTIFKEKASVLPTELKSYDPSFWKGYNIVEPNQTLKDFKQFN